MPQTLQILALADVRWSATATIAGPAWAQETRTVSVMVEGEHVRLKMRIHAYAGLHARDVKGVINFVGGWNGTRCPHRGGDQPGAARARGAYPDDTLCIYGDGDVFYSLAHSRANFAAFQKAGGRGEFHELPAEAGGHYPSLQPDRWSPPVESYLKRRGLSSEKP